MNILITGIRGFIGFNAIQQWVTRFSENNYVGLDGYTYADKFMQQDKDAWLSKHNIPHYVCDLASVSAADVLETIICDHKIDAIVNFAAESHVDNSLKNPNIFFQSNVIGTANLLNAAKKHNLRFHQVSTDEVYGITHPSDNCFEDYKIEPSSPYSSSKASADFITLSYWRSFKTPVTVSRCSNNFGPWQMSEKLIPTVIINALQDKKIPVYGDGMQKRHWISVDEHNDKLMWILKNGECGRVYNIAPTVENYISNMTLIKDILKHLNKPESLIEHVTDRLGHDTSYYLYSTFCTSSRHYLEDLKATIDWYVSNLSKVYS